jgi:hypothetical protein
MELLPSQLLEFAKLHKRQSNFYLQIHISVATDKTKLLGFILSSLTLKEVLKVTAVIKHKNCKVSTMSMIFCNFR